MRKFKEFILESIDGVDKIYFYYQFNNLNNAKKFMKKANKNFHGDISNDVSLDEKNNSSAGINHIFFTSVLFFSKSSSKEFINMGKSIAKKLKGKEITFKKHFDLTGTAY